MKEFFRIKTLSSFQNKHYVIWEQDKDLREERRNTKVIQTLYSYFQMPRDGKDTCIS